MSSETTAAVESVPDLLRRAVEQLRNPVVKPGMLVQYDSPENYRGWERRRGRFFLVVEASRGFLALWIPADDGSADGKILLVHESYVVRVASSEVDRVLAEWLEAQAQAAADSIYQYCPARPPCHEGCPGHHVVLACNLCGLVVVDRDPERCTCWDHPVAVARAVLKQAGDPR